VSETGTAARQDETPPDIKGYLSPDRAISSRKEDLLDRANFATEIARALASWNGEDSLVVALYGEWGSGKSSVKNMAVEALRSDRPQISIIEFNPWEWADRNRLAQAFFESVAIALGRDPDKGKRRMKKWREYAAYLGVASAVATQARYLVGSLAGLAVVMFGASGLSSGRVHTALTVGAIVLGLGAVLTGAFKSVAASVVEALTERAVNRAKSLPEVKADVAGMLRELSEPVLVVMDDIDRLTPQEQQVVFQLVKANADFPKLVYLLSFDRSGVAKALSASMAIDGEGYLDKIVQVGFDLPRVGPSDVHSILTKGLDSVLGSGALQTKFDPAYWERIFGPGVAPYFGNLRHVRRFLNTLQFQVGLLTADGVLEVNPVDLVAIEALRVFEPSLYRVLPGLREDLIEDVGHIVFDREARVAGLKKAIDAALESVPSDRRGQALGLLCGLFPAVAKAYGHTGSSDTTATLLVQSRIAHSEYFDRYFLFRVPEGELGDAAFHRLMSSQANRQAFVGELRELGRRGLYGAVFDRLFASAGAVGQANIQLVVTAILDVGDLIPRDRMPSFVAPPDLRARFTVDALLERLPTEDRLAMARACLANTTGLYLPVVWVGGEVLREGQQRPADDYVLAAAEAESVRVVAVEKLRTAAASHELDSNEHLGSLLNFWRELGDEDGVRTYVAEFLSRSDKNAPALLEAVSGTVSGSSGVRLVIQLSTLELYADLAAIDSALARLVADDLQGDRLRAVQAFEKAKTRREEGLPESPFAFDD
jgi:predicted KAP-like P-loop ATPase